ncbi:hypothetical protein JG491_37390 [Streptomyces sp. CRPSP2-6A1]|nr:hypothetical protein [Streptomyces sp. CRPSP2-6A1]
MFRGRGRPTQSPPAQPTTRHGLPAEPKWDGFRAQLAVYAGRRVLLRSRRGTDMTAAFPEINAAAHTQLPADTGLAAYGDDHHLGVVHHLLIVGAYMDALGALGQFGGRAGLRQGEGHRATHRPCCAGPRRWPGRSRPLR